MPICPACEQECRIVEIDEGIGYTEAWGVPHTDVHLVLVSDCCDAPIEDEEDIGDYRSDERDYDDSDD